MGYKRAKTNTLLHVLELGRVYILSLMFFVVKNKYFFILNSENHIKSTRQLNNLYHPIINLTVYKRGLHYMGIRIFNNLPPYIKDISNYVKKFENCLK